MLASEDADPNEDFQLLLHKISEQEDDINSNLDSLLSKQSLIESKMSAFGHFLGSLNSVNADTKKLSLQISHTANLAESVSAKVRCVDLARSRASECQQRVHDLIDLQLCSHGVLKAIDEEDYEKGSALIGRFLSIDQNVLQRTAGDVGSSGSVTSVSDAVHTLENATAKMRKLVEQRFDEAVNKDDLASVERFLKLFPLLGMHYDGIEKFGKYICMKLAIKSEKEVRTSLDIAKAENRLPVAFADTLTSLLENFARVIEVNKPIIEAYYGSGYLITLAILLQNECDSEVKNVVLEFNKNRRTHDIIQQINDYNRSTGGSMPSLSQYQKQYVNMEKPQLKDIDPIIVELTIMHSRVELYFRFLRRKVKLDIDASNTEEIEKERQTQRLTSLLNNSDLSRQMQELLSTYLLLERHFMEESVYKAIALDTFEAGQQCSSMVDDVFYILRKCIRRSLTTQSVNGLCAVINNAASCLYNFINALKIPLKNGYPSGYTDLAYSAIQSAVQHGKLQSSDSEKARTNFINRLNNADMSTQYLETLWETIEQDIKNSFPSISATERRIVDSCISELRTVRDTLKACVNFGMTQLRSSAIKPRLNPWVDQFLNYSHILSEEELADYEAGETYIQTLIVQLDGFLSQFKNVLTPRNFDAFVSILAADTTSRLERVIKKTSFNRLGGLILDQEIRALSSYLTGVTSWSVRDKMTRLTQIATILNLEKVDELSDYWSPENGNETPSWRLTAQEVRTLLALRTDFRMDEIKRVKL
ncbi:conserved oligomeric Golgi complex subunit 4 [Rhagoletis pomonella]|uniref:conserved oligomeric Golgi complex subunit 4 n=1 Tax=Rhagoletis pomonella TaxID=28610 RepID=UPI001783686B|nr:conserved oligomeric Golgi complex subunit 4 [Rhagoletis pomonella]XP_036324055.1 conserved oligomeric Golgi complex subunit 4 [Rhagoletis pomonella]XP_036324056.1 conserved oligomeric Golgi complex subunit 4 [Rhagoletis pomonella]